MSTVMDRTATDALIEQAKTLVDTGKGFLLATFAHVPDEKLHWSPSPTAKSALRVAAHAGVSNGSFVMILRGEKPPVSSFEELTEMTNKAELGITTREQAVGLIESSCAEVKRALDALTPDQVTGMIDLGFFPASPTTFFMFLPGAHLTAHSSQVDFLETCWGDLTPHFA